MGVSWCIVATVVLPFEVCIDIGKCVLRVGVGDGVVVGSGVGVGGVPGPGDVVDLLLGPGVGGGIAVVQICIGDVGGRVVRPIDGFGVFFGG